MKAEELRNLLKERQKAIVDEQVSLFLKKEIELWISSIDNGDIPTLKVASPRFLLPKTFSSLHIDLLKEMGYTIRCNLVNYYVIIKE